MIINNVNKIKKSSFGLLAETTINNKYINKINNYGNKSFTTSTTVKKKDENSEFEQLLKNTPVRFPGASMNIIGNKPKVCIGMSGGVDSTIAAKILKQQGFDVTGVFIKSWDEIEESGKCQGERDWKDAVQASEYLNIPMYKADFVKDYWNRVFSNFLKDYQSGQTPNPDVWCNRFIKFDLFLDFAKDNFGVDYIATGHYSNLYYNDGGGIGSGINGISTSAPLELHRGIDKNKDQTYFLCMTKGEKLAQSIFPIGGFTKEKIVSFAKSIPDFSNITSKRSSRGICFIGKKPLPDFLSQYIPLNPGPYYDISKNIYITHENHKGSICYTIGQKANISSVGEKYYVVKTDIENNIVYVCPESKVDQYLTFHEMNLHGFNWINEIPNQVNSEEGFKGRGICRHRGDVVDLIIKDTGKKSIIDNTSIYSIKLDQPLKSVASGQILCLFDRDSDRCFGGGIIDSPSLTLQ